MPSNFPDDFSELKKVVLGIKPHPHLREVKPEHSFKLKKNHSDLIAEIFSLENLFKFLERVPHDAIIFHLRDGKNDFATWVEEVFGNEVLSKNLKEISLSEKTEDTRWKLVSALYNEINTLKKLSELHPDDL